jgi:protein NrfD
MKEELFVSGRNIPGIDPHLNIWHWPIPTYLFLGGMAAGILFFASLYTILNKEKELPTAVKWSTFLAPFFTGARIVGPIL